MNNNQQIHIEYLPSRLKVQYPMFAHMFCSMLIMQVIDCRKVKMKTLIIRTDLQDGVMDDWSLVSNTEDIVGECS